MIVPRLQTVIQASGFREDYINAKVEEVLAVAKMKHLNIARDTPMLVGYDMNGPLTSVTDAMLNPLPMVRENILALDGPHVKKALISGWDITTLRYFRDERLKIPETGIVGELGMVWEHEGKTREVSPIERDERRKMMETLVTACAKRGFKIAIQGNVSSRVAGLFFEADTPSRGNLCSHPLVEGEKTDVVKIFNALGGDSGFTYKDGRILFPQSSQYTVRVASLLQSAFPLQSVRLASQEDNFVLCADERDDESLTLQDIEEFLKNNLPSGWAYTVHKDFGADIVFEKDGAHISKESTAYILAAHLFRGDSFLVTHVGDRISDVFVEKNSIFFAQEGTAAENYCGEKNIPFVPVLHGGDYSLILAALLSRERP